MIANYVISVPEYALTDCGALLFCVNTSGKWQFGSAWASVAAAKRHVTSARKKGWKNEVVILTPSEVANNFNIDICFRRNKVA